VVLISKKGRKNPGERQMNVKRKTSKGRKNLWTLRRERGREGEEGSRIHRDGVMEVKDLKRGDGLSFGFGKKERSQKRDLRAKYSKKGGGAAKEGKKQSSRVRKGVEALERKKEIYTFRGKKD